MDHIDAMTQLRENVAFAGYAQKDPLVEYKSLSYEMFMEMLAMVRANTVNALFKIDVTRIMPQQITIQPQIKNMQTNEAQIEAAVTKEDISTDNSNPAIVKVSANDCGRPSFAKGPDYSNVGRNDACPCGSGKKFKKCHDQA